MPTVSDFIKSMLALLMWRENNEDGLQGMTAVGLVVRNRVTAGWNSGDWLAVMRAHRPNMTSPTSTHSTATAFRWPDTRDPQFQAVLQKADAIYEGTEADITAGGLYYAALAGPEISPWFVENIVQKPEAHPRLGTVGQRTFFS